MSCFVAEACVCKGICTRLEFTIAGQDRLKLLGCSITIHGEGGRLEKGEISDWGCGVGGIMVEC